MSQDDRVDQAAEFILAEARVRGERAGLSRLIAATYVLELAYAKAIADMVRFTGSDDPDRLHVAVTTLRKQLEQQVTLQVVLRRNYGHG